MLSKNEASALRFPLRSFKLYLLIFQGKFSQPPYILVSKEHTFLGRKHDAATVWGEDVESTKFTLCLREMQNFDGLHERIVVVSATSWFTFLVIDSVKTANYSKSLKTISGRPFSKQRIEYNLIVPGTSVFGLPKPVNKGPTAEMERDHKILKAFSREHDRHGQKCEVRTTYLTSFLKFQRELVIHCTLYFRFFSLFLLRIGWLSQSSRRSLM